VSETMLDEIRLAAEALEAAGEDIESGERDGSYKALLEEFTTTYAPGYEPENQPGNLEEFREELYTAEFNAIFNYMEEAEVVFE
jgi:hypothetical protein